MLDRLVKVFQGMMRLFVSNVERDNPEALLENEKENLREQMARFNQGLVSHAAMCERLIRQVQKLQEDQEEITTRTRANLSAGNREAAAELALRLQTVKRELEENRVQAEEAEVTYKDLVRARDAAVDGARKKIEKLSRSINEMRMQQAMADLNQMAAGLMTSVGGTGETLARLEEMVEGQRSEAVGTTRVSKDTMNIGDLEQHESEQRALADQALADFAAIEGIELEGGDSSTTSDTGSYDATTKIMGPGASESE